MLNQSRWIGKSSILPSYPSASPSLKYLTLTSSFIGIQLLWSCEMAQASPYLLSLGLSKSAMSIVFLAGPLSGLLVQPVVGIYSDRCKSRWGRRRPFIVGGCIVASMAVMLLGWAKEVASIITTNGSINHSRLTIALAIFSIYLIDFSINVVQAMDRSLLVDVIPPHLQAAANAWASRLFGIGAVAAYFVAGLDLPTLTNQIFGKEQLKVITVFTAGMLCATHGITCWGVKERVLIESRDEGEGKGLKEMGEQIWKTLKEMPRPLQQVLNVQFTSWIGWFPILFFSTTWVAEVYTFSVAGTDLVHSDEALRELATRAGSKAMFYHALVSLSTSILLPFIIASTSSPSNNNNNNNNNNNSSQLSPFTKLLKALRIPWLSLPILWTLSNGFFSILLFGTGFMGRSVGGASVIIALTGFCWAVTNWCPFSILGDLILRLGAPQPPSSRELWDTPSIPLLASLFPQHDPVLSDDDSDTDSTRLRKGVGLAGEKGTGAGYRRKFGDGGRKGLMLTKPPSSHPPPLPSSSSSTATFTQQQQQQQQRRGSASSSPYSPKTSSILNHSTSSITSAQNGFSPRHQLSQSISSDRTTTTSSHRNNPLGHSYSHSRKLSSSYNNAGGGTVKGIDSPTGSVGSEVFWDAEIGTPLQSEFGFSRWASASLPLPPLSSHQPIDNNNINNEEEVEVEMDEKEKDEAIDPFSSTTSFHLEAYSSSSSLGHDPYSPLPEDLADDSGIMKEVGRKLEVRHEDSFEFDRDDDDDGEGGEYDYPPAAIISHGRNSGTGDGDWSRNSNNWDRVVGEGEDGEEEGSEQAGVILGCHNIYLVLPQFLVTALSSLIFAILSPSSTSTTTIAASSEMVLKNSTVKAVISSAELLGTLDQFNDLLKRAEGSTGGGGWDALALIFRLGGVATAISTVLCWQLARDARKERMRTLRGTG